MKHFSLLLTISLVIFLLPKKIYAVLITINNFPSSVSSEIFNVEASISGATNATNYLRIDLYKEGTTNYFGETFNGSDWYNGSDGKSYYPIQIQNSSASAIIQAQIGNPSNGHYPGPGIYKMKIRRYTASGSYSSNDIQTPVDINLTYVIPTPTPTETPTTNPTATQTSTPTPTQTSTPTPTKTPTQTSTPTPTTKSSPSPTLVSTISSVLSISTDSATLSTPTNNEIFKQSNTKQENRSNNYKLPFFVGLSLVIVSSGLLYFRHRGD